MASIDEELSDKENQSMVDLDGNDVLGFDDERSHDTASLLIKNAANVNLPLQKPASLTPVTPQKLPPAGYPPMLSDNKVSKLRASRSVCSGITATAHAIVSHVPNRQEIVTKTSASTYDGKIERRNVKRSAKYQG